MFIKNLFTQEFLKTYFIVILCHDKYFSCLAHLLTSSILFTQQARVAMLQAILE